MADNLYNIGQQCFMFISINKGDLLVLKLEWVNLQNDLILTESDYSENKDALDTYLQNDNNAYPKIILQE